MQTKPEIENNVPIPVKNNKADWVILSEIADAIQVGQSVSFKDPVEANRFQLKMLSNNKKTMRRKDGELIRVWYLGQSDFKRKAQSRYKLRDLMSKRDALAQKLSELQKKIKEIEASL